MPLVLKYDIHVLCITDNCMTLRTGLIMTGKLYEAYSTVKHASHDQTYPSLASYSTWTGFVLYKHCVIIQQLFPVVTTIIESVDSICRDGADTPIKP